MTLRQRFLQFSLRSILLVMVITGISIQAYRYVAYERKVRAERLAIEAKIDATIARTHKSAPLCGVLFLGQLDRDLEKNAVYQSMPAGERNRLASKIEAERAFHFDRGDHQAVVKTKKPFVKVLDKYLKD